MDSGVIVKEFRNRFGAIIANGQGSMKGQIFRIAHLGYFDFADLFAMVAGLEIILNANGYPVEFGTGVRRRAGSLRAAAVQIASCRVRTGPVRDHIYEHPDRRASRAAGIELFQVPARLERHRFQSQGIRRSTWPRPMRCWCAAPCR